MTALLLFSVNIAAQSVETFPSSVKVAAGEQYKRSFLYKWLWGKNRREEWIVPVQVTCVQLDTVFGGLTPYKKGGGNESKSLRLRSAAGKEYVLRSLDKSRKDVIPGLLKHTPVGGIIQDGVSMSYPYAALAVPIMLDHAEIPHTRPKLVYIPQQASLDSFNERYANDLYFLEERPDGDWSGESHLGNFHKFLSTLDLLRKALRDNVYMADQQTFIKARLFDILIADWDRHHDNWRWGLVPGSSKQYLPVPRDRDQAFFTRDGILTKIMVPLTRVRFMQNFDYKIKNVKTLTSQDRKVDRVFTNAMTLQDWLAAAGNLRRSLTDSVIVQSIKELPPEVFAISGHELIEKLKARRDNLEKYATQFYSVLAKKVEINGSEKKEYFEIRTVGGNGVSVAIFRMTPSGQKEATPYYRRVFFRSQTRSIILNGFGGEDIFDVQGKARGIRLTQHPGKSRNPLFKWAEQD